MQNYTTIIGVIDMRERGISTNDCRSRYCIGNSTLTLIIEDYEICNKLKSMRFSGMAEALEEVFKNPNADLLPFRDIINKIVDAEWDLRYNKKLNRFLKKATLKYPGADFDDTIYDPSRMLDTRIIEELAKCEWIEHGRNLC